MAEAYAPDRPTEEGTGPIEIDLYAAESRSDLESQPFAAVLRRFHRRSIKRLTPLAIVGTVLAIGLGPKPASEFVGSQQAADATTTITGCGFAASHRMSATISVTNQGTATASYIVFVTFAAADGTVSFGTEVTTAHEIPVGRTTDVVLTSRSAAPAAFTCVVAGASRL